MGPATADGSLLHGYNYDLMHPDHALIQPYLAVLLYRPSQGIPFFTVNTVGTVGANAGMNEAGISVAWDNTYLKDRELVEGILQHRYELAVVARVPYPEKITYIPYTRDDILLVVSPHHHLASRKTVSLSELAQDPVILTDAKSAVKFSVWKEFEKHNLHPSAIIEAGNIEFIKQLVQRGDGISFVVREAVAVEVREKKLATVPVEGDGIYLDVHIAYLEGRHLSPPAKAFLDDLLRSGTASVQTSRT